jgi:hypothetical protein
MDKTIIKRDGNTTITECWRKNDLHILYSWYWTNTRSGHGDYFPVEQYDEYYFVDSRKTVMSTIDVHDIETKKDTHDPKIPRFVRLNNLPLGHGSEVRIKKTKTTVGSYLHKNIPVDLEKLMELLAPGFGRHIKKNGKLYIQRAMEYLHDECKVVKTGNTKRFDGQFLTTGQIQKIDDSTPFYIVLSVRFDVMPEKLYDLFHYEEILEHNQYRTSSSISANHSAHFPSNDDTIQEFLDNDRRREEERIKAEELAQYNRIRAREYNAKRRELKAKQAAIEEEEYQENMKQRIVSMRQRAAYNKRIAEESNS